MKLDLGGARWAHHTLQTCAIRFPLWQIYTEPMSIDSPNCLFRFWSFQFKPKNMALTISNCRLEGGLSRLMEHDISYTCNSEGRGPWSSIHITIPSIDIVQSFSKWFTSANSLEITFMLLLFFGKNCFYACWTIFLLLRHNFLYLDLWYIIN